MNLQLESITLDSWPFKLLGIAYGQGKRLQLEVLYSEYDRTPSPTQLRSAWKARQDGRGVPLLIVVLHKDKAHVCGPSGEDPTVYPSLDPGQVERICQEALEQPSRQSALRSLRDSLGSLEEDGLPGLRNEGFLASHELTTGVPTRSDWASARDKARGILDHTGKPVIFLEHLLQPVENPQRRILEVGEDENLAIVPFWRTPGTSLASYRGRLAATCGSPDETEVLDSDKAAWGFAPHTAAPASYTQGDRFDLLIATDVLAEGVNLQQCRNIINYDLPWNPMRLVQRHGRIDRLLSQHKRVFLRTFFPDEVLDSLLKLEERVRRKLALAAASVGLADAPIQEGAQRDQSFSETREEIERIESEETDIFEKGGTDSAAQTGEEYRQELRKALNTNLKNDITELPWKAGSGMVKGARSGHFFCAKVGDQTFLRFVPEGVKTPDNLVEEIGTCLRLIECVEETERALPDSAMERAYRAWELARENIWGSWDFFTDPSNLQPKVRKLNREVDSFLLENPPADVDRIRLDRVSETLMSPWPMREENKLREVWKEEHPSHQAKALALIEAVEETGIEPFEQPERFPKIERDEVRLVCWLAIQAEPEA